MGIYRGAGGSGDAINDSSSEALITIQARDAALAAQAAAEAAQVAAELAETNAETAETNAETAETNAETAETNAETAQAAAEVAQAAAEAVLVDPDFVAVAAIEADIATVAGIAADVTTVAGISADVTAVAAIDSDVSTVASDIADVTTVASNIGSVNTVSGISSNVTTVAGISSNVTTVAGISSNVTTVAGISGNVTTVAGISSNVTTVAGISADVTTVAGDSADIQLLADNIATIAAKANAGANSDITSLSGLTTPLSVGQGGTGANTLTGYVKGAGTTALTASSTIPNTDISGLGTMSTQAASNVAITGGSINGTTVGASTAASGAFTSLTSSSTTTLNGTTIPASKTLLVSTDIGSTVQAYDAQLADVAGLTPTDNNFIVGNGTNFVTESGSTARTSLGLGSIATQDSSNVTVTGGTINGTTVGATTASTGKFTTLEATGVTTVQAGTNSAPAITTTGDTNTGIFFPAADTIAFTEGGAEAMRIDSDGDVGIGTTSPSEKLQVGSTSNRGNVKIISTDGNGISLQTGGGGGGSGTAISFYDADTSYAAQISTGKVGSNTAYLVFSTANGSASFSERMRITSGGDVGIGTSSPLGLLDVVSSSSAVQRVRSSGTAGANTLYQNSNTGTTTADGLYVGIDGTAGYLWNFENQPVILATNNTERMRITSAGDVGIGITPDTKFEVSGTGAVMRVSTNHSTSGTLDLSADATAAQIKVSWYNSAVPLVFKSGNTEQMRITTGGILLVGKTTTGNTDGFEVRPNDGGTGIPLIALAGNSTNSAATAMQVFATSNSTFRFYVDYAGTIFAQSTTISGISDQRLKENITDLDAGLNAVMALKPRKFDWKEGKGKDIKGDRGFIAQEFETVFPDMIDTWKDPAPEGEEPYKSVRADLIPVLVKAMQELNAKVEAQATEIALLKSK